MPIHLRVGDLEEQSCDRLLLLYIVFHSLSYTQCTFVVVVVVNYHNEKVERKKNANKNKERLYIYLHVYYTIKPSIFA